MPETPNHHHPDYEATFSKVATILEQIAQAAQRSSALIDKLTEALDRLTVKSAETEDKINGLIDLMDRHIREHGGK